MIRSYGPPDSGTPGNVGDLYIDAKTEEMYRCVKVIPDIVNQKNQFVTNYVHGPNTQYFWEKEQNAEFVVPDNCKIFNSFNNADNTVNRLISHIRIPEGIEEIGTNCFTGSTPLKSVYLPKSLKTISNNSFQGTGNLNHLTIPGGVSHIGAYAFSYSGIESLYIEDGLQELTENSLANMAMLKEVRLPNTLTSIGSGCLTDCYSLTKIFIPNSVVTIASDAFSNSLKEIIIDKPEGSISGAPWGANSECTITWLR